MGEIHQWRRNTRATIVDLDQDFKYYLELRADDDEEAVRTFWDDRKCYPEFIVAPNMHDSRTNTVTAANIRRMLGSVRGGTPTPIAVMLHGKKRRERVDMCHWLIENDYLPMFPRYMHNEASPSVPLTRLQLIHEMRPIIDREPEWLFVCYGMHESEGLVSDYIRTTQNNWEVLF